MTEGDHTPMAISVNLVLSFVCSCMRGRRVGGFIVRIGSLAKLPPE